MAPLGGEDSTYDRWVNLVEVCEARLLVAPKQLIYGWPKEVRHAQCDHNYLEAMHLVAGVPYELQVRFYPSTEEERAWARERARQALGRGRWWYSPRADPRRRSSGRTRSSSWSASPRARCTW
jgi:hypothetical protein